MKLNNREMTNSTTFGTLLVRALTTADPYLALAIYPMAGAADQHRLDGLILGSRRNRLRFAAAPYVPAALLIRLSEAADHALAMRLAKNPVTPAEVLEHLARVFAERRQLSARLCSHPRASTSLLKRFVSTPPASVRRAIAGQRNADTSVLAAILPVCTEIDRKLIAGNPQADAAILNELWIKDDEYLSASIAAHAHCPQPLMDAAHRSAFALIRRKLAENPAAPADLVAILLRDPQPRVRAAAAGHVQLGPRHLMEAANDPSVLVRRVTARRTNLDAEILDQLAGDPDTWVRRWIARHPTLPGTALRQLAEDGVPAVRRAVVRNPRCPSDIVARSSRDGNSWVRAGAALRHDLPQEVIATLGSDDDLNVLAALAQNPRTKEPVLTRFAEGKNADLRRAVILNQNAGADLLLTLVQDPYALNRVLLSRHPLLSDVGLWFMLEDPEPRVRFHVARRLVARTGDHSTYTVAEAEIA